MQQTEKYKLNLIESSDPFLPEGLNENTQKVEDVLKEKMEGPVAALDARVTELEKLKLAYGKIPSSNTVELPFQPVFVAVNSSWGNDTAIAVAGHNHEWLDIAENRFSVDSGHFTYYIALGY